MLRKKRESTQLNMFDRDYLFEELIPKKNWARSFRKLFSSLLPEGFFADMYHETLGRPANDPVTLTAALALQEYLHLSDRELERRVRYDLEFKYALGLSAVHKGFDHSIFDAHRSRLRQHGKDQELFSLVLKRLVDEGVLIPNETMFVDATHIEPSITLPSAIALTRRAITDVIRALHKAKAVPNQTLKELGLGGYLSHIDQKEKAGRLDEGKLSDTKRAEALEKLHTQAKALLEFLDSVQTGDVAKDEVQVLRTVFVQSLEQTVSGVKTIKRNDTVDRIVSVADAEARYGVKNKLKTFNGYKASIAVTKSGVVTATSVCAGNVADGKELPRIAEQLSENDLSPSIVVGDSGYGWGENQEYARDNGFELYARPNNFRLLPEGFVFDEGQKTIVCPRGISGKPGAEVDGKITYSFLAEGCRGCDRVSSCRKKGYQKRFTISKYYSLNDVAHKRTQTEKYKTVMRDRYVVERAFFGIAVASGMRWIRRRGKRNAEYALNIISAMTNTFHYLRQTGVTALPRMV